LPPGGLLDRLTCPTVPLFTRRTYQVWRHLFPSNQSSRSSDPPSLRAKNDRQVPPHLPPPPLSPHPPPTSLEANPSKILLSGFRPLVPSYFTPPELNLKACLFFSGSHGFYMDPCSISFALLPCFFVLTRNLTARSYNVPLVWVSYPSVRAKPTRFSVFRVHVLIFKCFLPFFVCISPYTFFLRLPSLTPGSAICVLVVLFITPV